MLIFYFWITCLLKLLGPYEPHDLVEHITRTLVLSKIYYALTCSRTAVSNIKILYQPYYSAVRRSLRAFWTTNTLSNLVEAGMPTILVRIEKYTKSFIHKLFNGTNYSLLTNMKKCNIESDV